ncbi:MAG: putative serine/threonine protein kinase, partial [Streblomastix strix]
VRATIPKKNWLELNMRDYATELIFSYPQPRTDIYLTFDTEPLKKSLVKWASKITYALRFDELNVQMPVASSFENFIGISILLIYSLLMISVDTRTFEIGILRMVGLDRLGVIGVLIAQALLYSIPGWILGIILGFVGNFVVMYILEDSSSVPLQKLMPVLSIVISTLIAFGIFPDVVL